MAPTRLTSGRAENHSAAYTTDAISPAPNRLILAWALNVQTAAGNPDMPAAAAAGLTLEQVATVLVAGTPDRRLTCFRAMSLAPGTGAITFTFATLQAHCAWSIFAYDDFDPSGTNGAAAIAQHKSASGNGATLSLALDPLGDTARSIVAAGLILRGSKPVNPGAGLVEIDEQVFPAASAATLEMAARVGGGETVSWSWTGAEDAAAIAIEIKPPPIVVQLQARDDPEALARKFEPIVIFHPDERFFPCDAKRYVEHCAMWKAEAPFDNKAAWARAAGSVSLNSLAGGTPTACPSPSYRSQARTPSPIEQPWRRRISTRKPTAEFRPSATVASGTMPSCSSTIACSDCFRGGRRRTLAKSWPS
jgi:hypothetical protein